MSQENVEIVRRCDRGWDGFLRWVRAVEEIWDQFTAVPDEFIDAEDRTLSSPICAAPIVRA